MNVLKFTTAVLLVAFICTSDDLNAQNSNFQDNINWRSMDHALSLAEQQDKLILIDVYAEWCPYCQRMQDEVYPDELVEKVVEQYFVPVRINTESSQKLRFMNREFTQEEFARALRYQSVPTTYFMNKDGEVVGQQPGFLPVDVFSSLLEYVGSGAYEEISFDEFEKN